MTKKLLKNLLVSPVIRFLQLESASSLLLLLATAIAVYWANSEFSESYIHLFNTVIGFGLPIGHGLHLSVQGWINDALMAIFFFVVGMEIKSELTTGALASFDRAILPVIAAVGGMLVPALVYLMILPHGAAAHGWGIPMATDIAFAVGVLTLLGRRIPSELKIFLLALAIADDLGAVLVIAIFYTGGITPLPLVLAFLLGGVIWLLARQQVRSVPLHIALGILLWLLVHESGVHATIAGVALGFLMPHEDSTPDDPTPLERWVGRLHPLVGFVIMPVFALANAGVALQGITLAALFTDRIVSAVSYGLLIGKPLGIFLTTWIGVKTKLCRLPENVNFGAILGAGALGGIGFTMALFVAQLALVNADDLQLAKLGIIKGSVISAIVGSLILLWATRDRGGKISSRQESDLSAR